MLPGFFEGYFEGKQMATLTEAVGADRLAVIKPTFIYGGNEFAIAPGCSLRSADRHRRPLCAMQ